jgi:hypothetical protein
MKFYFKYNFIMRLNCKVIFTKVWEDYLRENSISGNISLICSSKSLGIL